jgi:16S rRNA (guanine527-N7)-methyltransferase
MLPQIEKYVSRETIKKYEIYYSMLRNWNRRTSLVQEDTIGQFWERHVLDSLQLLDHVSLTDVSIDMGAGAGFPGMVLAMAGVREITLCESNARKCVFLEEVARETQTKVSILCERVENVNNQYDVVVSRAMASLDKLIWCSYKIVSRETFCKMLLLKGENVMSEVEEAQKKWVFEYEIFPSVTSNDGKIVKISKVREKNR